MVLVDAGSRPEHDTMHARFLYRDRTKLAVYAMAMFGLALQKQGETGEARHGPAEHQPVRRAGRREPDGLPQAAADSYWWYWYGSEYEAHAYYLKLLARDRSQERGRLAAGQVPAQQPQARHLLELHPRHGAGASRRWPTTCKASGEDEPDMTVEVWIDGQQQKEVEITAANLFTFDNKFVLDGEEVAAGEHTVEIRKTGRAARSTSTAT